MPCGVNLGCTKVHQAGSLNIDVPDKKIKPLKWDNVPAIVPIHFFFFLTSIGKIISQDLSINEAT